MSRLMRSETEEREEFMRTLFVGDPTLSVPRANELFYEKFGSRLRAHRAYAIRNIILSQLDSGVDPGNVVLDIDPATLPPPKKRETVTANRAPRGLSLKGDNVTLLYVTGGAEAAVEAAIRELHRLKICRAHVQHRGEGYLVLVG